MTRILVTGKSGQLGWELQGALRSLGFVLAPERVQLDLANGDSIRKAIREAQPEIIVNAAGYTTVDNAETDRALAMQVNGTAPGIMAEEARRIGALLVHYSTDYVFDGELGRPYREDDLARPVNAYGASKLAGERAIEAAGGDYLILRTSWLYSDRRRNFLLTILRRAREAPDLRVVENQTGSPTWAHWLAAVTAHLLRDSAFARTRSGIYHLCAAGHASRYEFAQAIIRIAQEVSGPSQGWASLIPTDSEQYPLPARRPRCPVTDTDKIRRVFSIETPHWEQQLRSCVQELVIRARASSNREDIVFGER